MIVEVGVLLFEWDEMNEKRGRPVSKKTEVSYGQ
jgi:hypothetical protein